MRKVRYWIGQMKFDEIDEIKWDWMREMKSNEIKWDGWER